MADYLIQWGQYHPARLLLEEAKLSADAFHDEISKEVINYHFACIAHKERDWGKVMLLVDDAKYKPKSQFSWMKKVCLLVDSLHNFSCRSTSFQNNSTDRGFQHAKQLLDDSIKTIDEMHKNEKNKTSLGPYIKAKLLSKLGFIFLKESEEKHLNSKCIRTQQNLLKDAIRYTTESYNELKRLGYVVESLELMRTCIDMHMKMVIDKQGNEKKEVLLNAYDIGKAALDGVLNLIPQIMELSSTEEVGNMILPIQQEMYMVQFTCMNVMEGIMNVSLVDKKQRTEIEESKRLINRVCR